MMPLTFGNVLAACFWRLFGVAFVAVTVTAALVRAWGVTRG